MLRSVSRRRTASEPRLVTKGKGRRSAFAQGRCRVTRARREGTATLDDEDEALAKPETGIACFFDSGGPALFDIGGIEYAVGVNDLLWGSPHCKGGNWAFRVDTAVSQDFILAAIASNG